MTMLTQLVALLLVAASLVEAEPRVSYRNHKVLEVPNLTKQQAAVVHGLEMAGVDVWHAAIGGPAHLRVSPSELRVVNDTLFAAGMRPRVAVQDVQAAFDREQAVIAEADKQRGRASWVGKSFVRYSEIVSWLLALPSTCGGKCAVQSIGKSYENRDIYVVRLSNNVAQSGSRKILFFEANIHAREWLAHASVAWIIETLLAGYGTDAQITSSMDTYEWHFIVVANPDGYEYTWTNERLWRKTRSVYSSGRCYGADPNRNFDDHHCGEGTSTNPCSDTYCGPTPFSEKETQVIRDYTTALASRIKTFQSIHCYSQFVLLPFAYTSNAYPSDFAELTRVAKVMTDKILATSRKVYVAGNVADILYPAAGSTMDWARTKLNTQYPLAWELRPSQNAVNGFVVNPSEIEPTGNELLQALLAFVAAMN